jgi:predicted RNase H-like HicB family nuclease
MKKKITTTRNKPAKRPRPVAGHYLYTVGWSQDDETYVARVAEFPSLAAHGDTQEAALRSAQQVVRAVLKDMAASKEPIAQPIASVRSARG